MLAQPSRLFQSCLVCLGFIFSSSEVIPFLIQSTQNTSTLCSSRVSPASLRLAVLSGRAAASWRIFLSD